MKKNTFIFDIEKISEFVFNAPNERGSDVEISETFIYDDESDKMIPNVKEVKEVKVDDSTSQSNIRYDLIKTFIEILDSIEDQNVMTLGEEITFNTMQAYELIKDIKTNDNE